MASPSTKIYWESECEFMTVQQVASLHRMLTKEFVVYCVRKQIHWFLEQTRERPAEEAPVEGFPETTGSPQGSEGGTTE